MTFLSDLQAIINYDLPTEERDLAQFSPGEPEYDHHIAHMLRRMSNFLSYASHHGLIKAVDAYDNYDAFKEARI
jgi:hypothetical protein